MEFIVSFLKQFWDGEEDDCTICLDKMNANYKNEKVTTYECNHTFHLKCLNSWVIKSQTCPICRQMLKCCTVSTRNFERE